MKIRDCTSNAIWTNYRTDVPSTNPQGVSVCPYTIKFDHRNKIIHETTFKFTFFRFLRIILSKAVHASSSQPGAAVNLYWIVII
jgi:hypothetical protein